MPELPEVETVVGGLRSILLGKRVRQFVFLSSHLHRRQPTPALRPEDYRGKRIREIQRRGKMIIFDFEGGCGLLIHLKMTGQLYLVDPEQPADKHTHARMTFAGFRLELRFRDIRKFGFVNCLREPDIWQKVNSELGPEPLSLGWPEFRELLRKHGKKRIKGWLLDQKLIAGIGNIYSDEILFRAGVRPDRSAGSLSPEEARKVFRSMRAVLSRAIELKGSSVSDYVDSAGQKGRYQNEHRVYDREGEVCRRCRLGRIQRKKIAGRSSFFCPACQK
ncbi:MAG: bifunctional DNA-formamidopyrimidine glycosylase/DNA-(apurinic or apyrimidinic site) lyase [Candidatus Saccharicenans sp.]|uniref:bifunctional DNA-formamidopyrimidine glycosylase/DNA-(apurinic or apyrimidinic site) lyase n=1 Tax=Candidatus Saccharicenans sp. TaxID=2819258 RepID=UPI004049F1C0